MGKRLILVLGAGASRPYGFPTGGELLDEVFSCTSEVLDPLDRIGIHDDQVQAFRKELLKASPNSIDEFLEHRLEYRDVGKAFIACILMRKETHDLLYRRDRKGHWYDYLFQRIRGDSPNDLRTNSVGIITFNYDRSLEEWWQNKLASHYGKSAVEVDEMYSHLPVVHVHGQLGALPQFGSHSRPYDNVINSMALRTAIDGIRIVHDSTHDEAFKAAHELLRGASKVLFLGFGFLPKNVERLALDRCCSGRAFDGMPARLGDALPERATCHGTTLGFTASEVENHIQPLFKCVGKLRVPKTNPQHDVLEFLRNNNDLLT